MTDETDKIAGAPAGQPNARRGSAIAWPAGDSISETTMSGAVIPWPTPDYSVLNATVERLAKRLGVEPHTSTGPVTYVVSGEDGRSYAALDLAHAMLDRMDGAAK